MSFKNKINISVLILLMSVILLLFVIGVYAQDNSTVITNGTDINTTSINNTNNSIREVNVHNYDELKAAVDNLTSHPCEKLVINLEDGDYKINTAKIKVQSGQKVVINGNGHTIGCNKEEHFMDITKGGSVTINNLTVKNAFGVDGGAIYNTGTLTVTGSTFQNNEGCDGGTIYNKGALTVTGSTFTDNKANYKGGAIYNNGGTLTVTGSTFTDNKVESGGAIYNNGGTLTVTGSTFNNNKVVDDGGTIYNKAGTLTVHNSTFNNNKARDDGGAICSNGGKVNPIQECTFKNNIANSKEMDRCEGGAIKCTGNNNPLIVTNCQFIGNSAEDGGSIDCRVLKIRNCVFTENKASNAALACNGGAINCNDLNECHDCNFTSNTADNGGAIAIMEKAGINHIKNCIFKDNKATALKGGDNGKGGAIFVNRQAAHISLVHNQFINNYATNKADTVFNWGTYDKIEYNYFPNKDQNNFRDETGLKHKYIQDQHPFYNLDDYYKWKG